MPSHRVLVVDDEPLNREIVVSLLESPSLVIDQAADGVEALAMARLTRYDLILMDMQMPEMDGVDATRRIRGLPGYAGVPILAFTANTHDGARERCFEAGMNDFIQKPFLAERFFATVHAWLARRAAQ